MRYYVQDDNGYFPSGFTKLYTLDDDSISVYGDYRLEGEPEWSYGIIYTKEGVCWYTGSPWGDNWVKAEFWNPDTLLVGDTAFESHPVVHEGGLLQPYGTPVRYFRYYGWHRHANKMGILWVDGRVGSRAQGKLYVHNMTWGSP